MSLPQYSLAKCKSQNCSLLFGFCSTETVYVISWKCFLIIHPGLSLHTDRWPKSTCEVPHFLSPGSTWNRFFLWGKKIDWLFFFERFLISHFSLQPYCKWFPISCNFLNAGKFKELAGFQHSHYEEQLDLVLSFTEEIRIPILPPRKYSFCIRISLLRQACSAALQLLPLYFHLELEFSFFLSFFTALLLSLAIFVGMRSWTSKDFPVDFCYELWTMLAGQWMWALLCFTAGQLISFLWPSSFSAWLCFITYMRVHIPACFLSAGFIRSLVFLRVLV